MAQHWFGGGVVEPGRTSDKIHRTSDKDDAMLIDNLARIAPPPTCPDEVGTVEELRQIEKRFGFVLPSDYRDFSLRYGSGWFVDTFLEIWNPFMVDLPKEAADPNGTAFWFYKAGYLPWEPFPASPGLLEIGGNENGDTLLYLTEASPDEWSVLVVPHEDEGRFERWDMPLVTFLQKALTSEINTAALASENITPGNRKFTRVGDRWPSRREEWQTKRKSILTVPK
jgi:hypothetical protein